MTSLLDDEFHMLDQLNLQPSEIANMPWYKFVHFRNKLAEKLKAQNDENQRQIREQQSQKSSNPLSRFKFPKIKF